MRALLTLLLLLSLPCTLRGQGGTTDPEEYSGNLSGNLFMQLPTDESEPEEARHRYLLYSPLHAFPDPFVSLAEHNFSFVRYARRGYDNRYRRTTVNDIDLADGLSGNNYWGLLSAIGSARQGETYRDGLQTDEGSLGALAGVRRYDVGAEDRATGGRVGWMFTDRRFSSGFRFEATGALPGNCILTVSGRRRWGRDGHIRGVYTDDWSLFALLAKQVGPKNRFVVAFTTAPAEQGARGAATREAFALTGDNFYNPYWGYQSGRVRNARVSRSDRLLTLATWIYRPTERFHISTSVSALRNSESYSSSDWYAARNPTPDYYRYMPGYFAHPDVAEAARDAWKAGDPRVTQVDWDELYYVNRHGGEDETAAYVVGSRVNDTRSLQLASRFAYGSSQQTRWEGGVRLKNDVSTRYKKLEDLLSGAPPEDVDQFLVDDEYFGDKAQNDLRNPGRRVKVGERYGYHYESYYSGYEGWAMARWNDPERDGRLYGVAGMQAGWVSIRRQGFFEKELFPGDQSYGFSPGLDFTTYLLKGEAGYAFTPSRRLEFRVAYGDVVPLAGAVFVAPDYQNRPIDRPRPVNLLAGEMSFATSSASVRFVVNAYVTRTSGESAVYHFYDDLSATYSNLVLSRIDKIFAGVEAGVGINLTSRLECNAAAAISENSYMSDPAAEQFSDKDNSQIAARVRSYLKGYKLSGSPQRTASVELRYSGRKMWLLSVSVNYTGHHYIAPNPIRRMKRVCDYAASPEILDRMTAQERFPDATVVNLFMSKTFRIFSRYLSFTLSINNLADKRNIVYSGYEPMRLAKSGTGINRSVEPFASKYTYAYGRTYYATANFRF